MNIIAKKQTSALEQGKACRAFPQPCISETYRTGHGLPLQQNAFKPLHVEPLALILTLFPGLKGSPKAQLFLIVVGADAILSPVADINCPSCCL
ncbi:hypothetical protein SAMN04489798_3394 [Pseudomonas arsenicoxydans]|uniref:Uncharacterized protein n=1 Tax=Pseudomonas arsenicoxydans TaxID=702115 RepID=A0A1H0KYE9_9PSED|nr:hypothetical protein [Pseudomonas arsenicoxydans]SDO60791.1 hypothetical protein SAMN04489798_3394 [Pseudomonas arsenicoxydans]